MHYPEQESRRVLVGAPDLRAAHQRRHRHRGSCPGTHRRYDRRTVLPRDDLSLLGSTVALEYHQDSEHHSNAMQQLDLEVCSARITLNASQDYPPG